MALSRLKRTCVGLELKQEGRAWPCRTSAGNRCVGDQHFCHSACPRVTTKALRLLMWGSQVNRSESASLPTWGLQMMRLNHTYLRVELLGHAGVGISSFRSAAKRPSKVPKALCRVRQFTLPPALPESSSCSTSSPAPGGVFFFS